MSFPPASPPPDASPPATPAGEGELPLAGLRVLDLSRLLPGPFCTLILSDLGATVDRVAAANRDLGVGVLPDQWPTERIYFRSDHYNFARNGVPILFFTNGFHPDYHAVTDSPDKIDAEKESRVVRLIFETAQNES